MATSRHLGHFNRRYHVTGRSIKFLFDLILLSEASEPRVINDFIAPFLIILR